MAAERCDNSGGQAKAFEIADVLANGTRCRNTDMQITKYAQLQPQKKISCMLDAKKHLIIYVIIHLYS